MKKIDRNSSIPLYTQLTDILIEQIQSLEIGSQLDTERVICEKYNVSRITTRQALDELAANEYIVKVHGKGNFVANKYVEQKLIEIYSFTEEMKRLGKVPKSQYIAFEIRRAGNKLAEKLQLEADDEVVCFKRLRLGDGVPMMLETTYLPRSRFAGMTLELLKANSLYDLMRNKYDISFAYAEQVFRPVLISSSESETMKIGEGMPGLKIERFTYAKGSLKNSIVEYSVAIARGDVFKYRICLENGNGTKK